MAHGRQFGGEDTDSELRPPAGFATSCIVCIFLVARSPIVDQEPMC